MVKTYVDVRNEAVSQIKAAFTNSKGKCAAAIEAHPGRFDEAELRRLAQRTPAILTSLMRINRETNTAEFISWVLARAQSKDKLYDNALVIVSALIPVLENLDAEWSVDAPQNIEAECLYTGNLDAMNVTMWAVKWDWRLTMPVLEEGAGGLPVYELDWFEGYEAATQVGAQEVNDTVNLEI